MAKKKPTQPKRTIELDMPKRTPADVGDVAEDARDVVTINVTAAKIYTSQGAQYSGAVLSVPLAEAEAYVDRGVAQVLE